jgi:predicted phosphodiesterase
MSKKSKNERVLVISDMHIPYSHQDLIPFLTEVKRMYNPDKVVCIGDELDKHSLSFHDSDPDLPSAGDELLEAIDMLQPIYKMFPEMDLVDSNHGSMVYRKGKHHGIPRKYLRSYGEVIDAPKGWVWHNDLKLTMSDGQRVYFHHGLASDGQKVAQRLGINFIQGHFHNSFEIKYTGTPDKLLWNMTIGCLIDDKALAFAYNKTTLGRPLIGLGIILDGQPLLIPMILDKNGRWIGELK